MDNHDLLVELVRQATQRRREGEQHFRAMIVAARANDVPLSAIAAAADLSIARIHAILKEEKMETYAPAPDSPAPTATDDVVVVAALHAYDEYLNYSAYVCQEGRSFRDVLRMGFYRRGEIKPQFPNVRAVEDHVPFSAENVARLRATGSPIDAEIAALIETLVAHNRRDPNDTYQVFLLTSTNDPRTLVLPQPIQHDTTGRGSAWTMGQRYISESSLLRNPRSTDDL